MPSHTAASALIKLYFLDGIPWKYPKWMEITGVKHGLFPSDDALLPPTWQGAGGARLAFQGLVTSARDGASYLFSNEGQNG